MKLEEKQNVVQVVQSNHIILYGLSVNGIIHIYAIHNNVNIYLDKVMM